MPILRVWCIEINLWNPRGVTCNPQPVNYTCPVKGTVQRNQLLVQVLQKVRAGGKYTNMKHSVIKEFIKSVQSSLNHLMLSYVPSVNCLLAFSWSMDYFNIVYLE